MTYIVNVGYTASDPRLAADVANAFANEYIAYSIGKRSGTASRETSYLDQRLSELNQQAAQADAQLAQYRAQSGIVNDGDATVTGQQISPSPTSSPPPSRKRRRRRPACASRARRSPRAGSMRCRRCSIRT